MEEYIIVLKGGKTMHFPLFENCKTAFAITDESLVVDDGQIHEFRKKDVEFFGSRFFDIDNGDSSPMVDEYIGTYE